jgi:hypothetical protein
MAIGVNGRFLEGSRCLCARSCGRQCRQSREYRSFEEPGIPDIQHHYARELIREGRIMLNYVPTAYMLADLLTKSLPRVLHLAFQRYRSVLMD